MNKIVRFFLSITDGIKNFFDKRITTPIGKIVHSISERFNSSGKGFENFLSKQTTLLFISLLLAFVIFVSVDQKLIMFSEKSAEVIKSDNVSVIYNEEEYVVEGIPSDFEITMIGRRNDLIFAKQAASHEVKIDLSGLKPGTHKVEINYKKSMPLVDYSVNPSVATIVIYPKDSVIKPLTVDVINQDKLPERLVIETVDISMNEVIIKGAEKDLERVASVKALVDVQNIPEKEVGETTLRNVPLVAYDKFGEKIKVEIVPEKVEVDIKIASPSKEVAIKIVPKGDMAFGYAIRLLELSETRTTIYGASDVLKDINFIEAEVDINDLMDDKSYQLELNKPTGVKTMSVDDINVNIEVGESSDREISGINIKYRNLNDEYSVQGLSEEDVRVVVGLKGVDEVIEEINPEDINAYVDLSGYEEGEHEVDVLVEGSDLRVNYIAKTRKVTVKIVKK